MKNAHPFYIVFQDVKIHAPDKNVYIIEYSRKSIYSFVWVLAFKSGDIIFHTFVKFYSISFEKRILLQVFPFLKDSYKPGPPST